MRIADADTTPDRVDLMSDREFAIHYKGDSGPSYVFDHDERAWRMDDRNAPPKNPSDPF